MVLQDHHVTLHQLSEAQSPAEHKAVIHASTPATGKALTTAVLELTRHGFGPTDTLAKAQLGLLAHPDSSHADFKKAAENQTGGGLGSFLSGLASAIFSPVAAIGKAVFGSHAAKAVAKSATEVAKDAAAAAAQAAAAAAAKAAEQLAAKAAAAAALKIKAMRGPRTISFPSD